MLMEGWGVSLSVSLIGNGHGLSSFAWDGVFRCLELLFYILISLTLEHSTPVILWEFKLCLRL